MIIAAIFISIIPFIIFAIMGTIYCCNSNNEI